LAYKIYRCESCPTKIAYEEKVKERPLSCPKCRGMLIREANREEFEGTEVSCPDCENTFKVVKPPFKCAFCDHTFSKDLTYF
jgi:hypothetical protein